MCPVTRQWLGNTYYTTVDFHVELLVFSLALILNCFYATYSSICNCRPFEERHEIFFYKYYQMKLGDNARCILVT